MLFIIGLVLVTIFALFLTASLRLTGKIAFVLCLYLAAWADIVLIGEVTGLAKMLAPLAWIGFQLLLALAAWYLWRRAGKPPLVGPLRQVDWYSWKKIPSILWLLIVGVGIVYLVGTITILIVPPNNYDGMTYHLARVGYWMQHGSLLDWTSANLRQTSSPMNAELGLLWTIQLWGTDQLAGFVQWLAAIFALIAVFGIARLLGASKAQSLFAGLVWATFPEIIFQSTSAQNDMVTTSFFIIAVYLLASGIRGGEKRILLASSLALGLALGTKVTVAFILPGMAIWLVILWIQSGRVGFRRLLTWGSGGLVAFLLFGAFSYVQSIWVYHSPIPMDEPEGGRLNLSYSSQTLLFSNLAVFSYQFLDPGGLPPFLAQPFLVAKAQIFPHIFNKLGIPVQQAIQDKILPANVFNSGATPSEDTAWFGPLAFLLLVPASIYQAVQGVRRKDSLRLGLLLMAGSFWAVLALLLTWTPYRGRYFVLAVTMLAPLIAFIYRPGRWRTYGLWIIALCAIAISAYVMLTNSSKPLIGPQEIWGKDAIQLQTIAYPVNEDVIRMVETQMPSNATLALKLGSNGWDYAFFGSQFQRTLVQVDPYFSRAAFNPPAGLQFDYLLVGPHQLSFLVPPAGLNLVAEAGKFQLYSRSASASGAASGSPTPQPFDSMHLIEVKPPLAGTVGVLQAWPAAEEWDIEQDGSSSFYWIGEGERNALGFSIWSEKTVDAAIALDVEPGPGRKDSSRTLDFITVDPNDNRVTVRRTFDAPGQLQFPVTLHAGYNEFRIMCEDFATVIGQPNGDNRPLLILLRHITILPSEAP